MHPIPGRPYSARYKQRGSYWSLDRDASGRGLHTGEDIAAPEGTLIVSATPGRVIAANAYDKTYGYKVIIAWESYEVWYCHMPSNVNLVKLGDYVDPGQPIGRVGSTGNVTGAHLHMELRVKGGKFALSTFRDPQIAINFKRPTLRYQIVNLADNNKIGIATRKIRRGRLLTDVLKAFADIDSFQEAPVDGIYKWMTSNISKRPRGRKQKKRQIVGAHGRRMWGGKRVKHIKGGKVIPKTKGQGGRDQPWVWSFDWIAGMPRLTVDFHGPFGIGRKKKRAYWKEFFSEVNKLRNSLGLTWNQVIMNGDANSRGEILAEAKNYDLVDLMSQAKEKKNRLIKSTNSWKRVLIPGKRIDMFIGRRGLNVVAVRNIRMRWNKKKTYTVTDHNRQVLLVR